MKRLILMAVAVCAATIGTRSSGTAFADARRFEWNGTWTMNHDGWRGQLSILANNHVQYRDAKGQLRYGRVVSVTDRNQRMRFYIDFSDHRQYFTAHIFSWDKKKMAGTTVWNGRTFGMYALKL
jgi:hypothetical protein